MLSSTEGWRGAMSIELLDEPLSAITMAWDWWGTKGLEFFISVYQNYKVGSWCQGF